jgi:hypothetical protein
LHKEEILHKVPSKAVKILEGNTINLQISKEREVFADAAKPRPYGTTNLWPEQVEERGKLSICLLKLKAHCDITQPG